MSVASANGAPATLYCGAERIVWLMETHDKPAPSEFGCLVANILGAVWRGIYHLPQGRLMAVEWHDPMRIELLVGRELATFDGGELTALVVLCHDYAVRLSVEPLNFQYLRLCFHRRVRDSKRFWERHPSLEANAAAWRKVWAQ